MREVKRTDIFRLIKNTGLIAIARLYKRKHQYTIAATFYKKALDKNTRSLRTSQYYEYAYVLYKDKGFKRALEQINYAIDVSKVDNAKYINLRAQIYIKLKQYVNAEYDLRNAIEIAGDNAVTHYLLGVVLVLQKKWYQAEEALLMAQKLGYQTVKFYRRLGQASFNMEHYEVAAESYRTAANMWTDSVQSSKTRAEMYYLAGLSTELDGGATKNVHQLYEQALALDTELESEKYGVGIFHFKQMLFKKALSALERDIKDERYKKQDILYKKGQVLYNLGELRAAIAAIEESLSYDYTLDYRHEVLANLYVSLEEPSKAAGSYKNAIIRKNDFDIRLYVSYMDALIQSGNSKAAEYVSHFISIVKDANTDSDFRKKHTVQSVRSYAAMYEQLSLNNEQIMYENFQGVSVGDSSAAILYETLQRQEFANYRHVVVLNDHDDLPDDLRAYKNIVVVRRGSFAYAYYLATSKYLINNSTFPWWFIRKEGQQYLNTWHGVPWKTLGRDMHTVSLEHGSTQRNFLQATHIINPNKHTTWAVVERYDVADIYNGKLAELGYPRIDITLNMSAERKREIKQALGIDSGKKIVFYAPTWRGIVRSRKDQTEQFREDIMDLLATDCEFIFRGHALSNTDDGDDVLNKYAAPASFSTNELLAIADILITDYSSLAFDFMATGKQLIYYLYDYEEYKTERGLYFEYDELPGEKTFSRDELINTVKKQLETKDYKPDAAYKKAIDRFCPHDDGKATERVIDFFFKGDTTHEIVISNNKQNLLFHIGSLQTNGITASGINLLNSIDMSKYNVHLIVERNAVEPYEQRLANLSKINRDIRIIANTGNVIGTAKEKCAIERYMNDLLTPDDCERQLLKKTYSREYRRIMADATIDNIINFGGYSKTPAATFGFADGVTKTIYAHNDIYSEYLNKYKYLQVIFDQYNNYDKVISVSQNTNKLNKENLVKHFHIPASKFDYIDNVQDPDAVIEKSKLPLEIAADEKLFADGRCTFITIGRLSAEKDHEKLIRAFARVHSKHNSTNLVIIGDGPLRYRLETVIEELNLKNVVHLIGLRSNPYPYLTCASCFVLSSNYEGQPVVLFEALMLNKPIIATDIVSNRGILQGGYGELCDNSIDGLADAMHRFIAGELHIKEFDIEKYNQHAMELFYEKVLPLSRFNSENKTPTPM